MMRSILATIGLLLLVCFTGSAQVPEKCELGIGAAPSIRRVKLGMTSKEVLDILGADLPVLPNHSAYLATNLKTSPYFQNLYSSHDPVLLALVSDLAYTETYAEKTPVLRIDLNFTQVASRKDLESMGEIPESLRDVVNFQVDLRDDRVVSVYFLLSSEKLDGFDDPGRVAALSKMLNLPDKSWTTGSSHHSISCGNAFDLMSHRAAGTPKSKISLLLRDIKETRRISADTEEFLRKLYEERKQKATAPDVDQKVN